MIVVAFIELTFIVAVFFSFGLGPAVICFLGLWLFNIATRMRRKP